MKLKNGVVKFNNYGYFRIDEVESVELADELPPAMEVGFKSGRKLRIAGTRQDCAMLADMIGGWMESPVEGY